MRPNIGTESIDEIDDGAIDWLIRRESDTWHAADQARLDEWLNASTLNRVAFLRLELAWENVARLKALGAGIPGDLPPPRGCWNLTPFFDSHPSNPSNDDILPNDAFPLSAKHERFMGTVRRKLAVASAAAVLLVIGISIYWVFAASRDGYSTAVGGVASVPMADGSKVTLNTDSQIRIALSDSERRVDLKHGEAYFEVAKDADRPFVVRAGSKRVIAVGTRFSVRREGDDVEVVVTEGKVRVENAAGARASTNGGSAAIILTPGNVARVSEAGVLVQREALPEAEERLSWRTGVLMFRDQSLKEAIAEFNRYNELKIVIQDPAIASLKIEGNFRATNVDAFVRLLESGFPVRAEVHADQIELKVK